MGPTHALLQAALDGMREGVLVVDTDGRVVFYNRAFATMFSVSHDGHADHGAVAAAMSAQLADSGPSPIDRPMGSLAAGERAVTSVLLKDGRRLEREILPLHSDRDVSGSVATYRDITRQTEIEEALADHRRMLEKAQEVAHVGSFVVALDATGCVSWSPEMARIHGTRLEDFAGTADAAAAFVHPEDREDAVATAKTAIQARLPYEHEHRIVRADGAVRWVRSNAHVVCDPGGKAARLVGTLQDVTERCELEEQLRQSQKMEAIGRLAGGIAHDLNNALTAIAGFAELALGELPPDHRAHGDVAEVRKAAERAGSVTRQLLAFSRRELLEPRLFNLGDTVGEIGRFLGRLIGDDIVLRTRVEPDLPLVLGDPGQVEQAIVNLAVNARDAMPEGGTLTIAVQVVERDEAFARAHVPMPPGRYVELSVADTGCGMSPETRARIFEPFFTTKPVGKGTGLGLSMAYGTLKQSGGFIFVDSEVGAGATFHLYFPPATASPADPPPGSASTDENAPTVLVVDDEPSVRALVLATLRGDGYRILLAATADEALRTAHEIDGVIDLLLTDATMPGTSGVELARELLARCPGLPVIIMSGYTQDHLALADLRGSVSVCQKPFTPRELRQRVRQALTR